MKHRIYIMSDRAKEEGMDWEQIFAEGEIVTVEEYETYEDAVNAFIEGEYDEDYFGVE